MLELTEWESDRSVWINPRHIVSMTLDARGGFTHITLVNGDMNVKEDPFFLTAKLPRVFL